MENTTETNYAKFYFDFLLIMCGLFVLVKGIKCEVYKNGQPQPKRESWAEGCANAIFVNIMVMRLIAEFYNNYAVVEKN